MVAGEIWSMAVGRQKSDLRRALNKVLFPALLEPHKYTSPVENKARKQVTRSCSARKTNLSHREFKDT